MIDSLCVRIDVKVSLICCASELMCKFCWFIVNENQSKTPLILCELRMVLKRFIYSFLISIEEKVLLYHCMQNFHGHHQFHKNLCEKVLNSLLIRICASVSSIYCVLDLVSSIGIQLSVTYYLTESAWKIHLSSK